MPSPYVLFTTQNLVVLRHRV